MKPTKFNRKFMVEDLSQVEAASRFEKKNKTDKK
jgi:hypothetical protein